MVNWVTVRPVLLPVSISLSFASKPVAALTTNVTSSFVLPVSGEAVGASFTGATLMVWLAVDVAPLGSLTV